MSNYPGRKPKEVSFAGVSVFILLLLVIATTGEACDTAIKAFVVKWVFGE